MPRAEAAEREKDDPVARAIANAKFKNARLRLLKARHERYLAEQREYSDVDEDEDATREL